MGRRALNLSPTCQSPRNLLRVHKFMPRECFVRCMMLYDLRDAGKVLVNSLRQGEPSMQPDSAHVEEGLRSQLTVLSSGQHEK